MVKFRKPYNVKIVAVFISMVFLCNTILYACPVPEESAQVYDEWYGASPVSKAALRLHTGTGVQDEKGTRDDTLPRIKEVMERVTRQDDGQGRDKRGEFTEKHGKSPEYMKDFVAAHYGDRLFTIAQYIKDWERTNVGRRLPPSTAYLDLKKAREKGWIEQAEEGRGYWRLTKEGKKEHDPKFFENGDFKPFYGLTCVTKIQEGIQLNTALGAIQDKIRREITEALREEGIIENGTDLDSYCRFLPRDSFHMTVCDIDPCGEFNPERKPFIQVTREQFYRRLAQVSRAFGKIGAAGTIPAQIIGVELKDVTKLVRQRSVVIGANVAFFPEDRARIVDIGDVVKGETGANVRSFSGHITLAYLLRDPGDKALARIEEIIARYSDALIGGLNIDGFDFTYFASMAKFDTISAIDLESGEISVHNTDYTSLASSKREDTAEQLAVGSPADSDLEIERACRAVLNFDRNGRPTTLKVRELSALKTVYFEVARLITGAEEDYLANIDLARYMIEQMRSAVAGEDDYFVAVLEYSLEQIDKHRDDTDQTQVKHELLAPCAWSAIEQEEYEVAYDLIMEYLVSENRSENIVWATGMVAANLELVNHFPQFTRKRKILSRIVHLRGQDNSNDTSFKQEARHLVREWERDPYFSPEVSEEHDEVRQEAIYIGNQIARSTLRGESFSRLRDDLVSNGIRVPRSDVLGMAVAMDINPLTSRFPDRRDEILDIIDNEISRVCDIAERNIKTVSSNSFVSALAGDRETRFDRAAGLVSNGIVSGTQGNIPLIDTLRARSVYIKGFTAKRDGEGEINEIYLLYDDVDGDKYIRIKRRGDSHFWQAEVTEESLEMEETYPGYRPKAVYWEGQFRKLGLRDEDVIVPISLAMQINAGETTFRKSDAHPVLFDGMAHIFSRYEGRYVGDDYEEADDLATAVEEFYEAEVAGLEANKVAVVIVDITSEREKELRDYLQNRVVVINLRNLRDTAKYDYFNELFNSREYFKHAVSGEGLEFRGDRLRDLQENLDNVKEHLDNA